MNKPLKITLIVVGSIVGLIVLAIIGGITYVALRPALPGDFSVAASELESADGPPLLATRATVQSLADPSSALTRENLETRYRNTRKQVETTTGYVYEAASRTVFSKDAEAKESYDKLKRSADELVAYVNDYGQLYVPYADASRVCGKAMAQSDKSCEELKQELKEVLASGTGNNSQRAAAQALVDGDESKLRDATTANAAELDSRLDSFTEQLKDTITFLKRKAGE